MNTCKTVSTRLIEFLEQRKLFSVAIVGNLLVVTGSEAADEYDSFVGAEVPLGDLGVKIREDLGSDAGSVMYFFTVAEIDALDGIIVDLKGGDDYYGWSHTFPNGGVNGHWIPDLLGITINGGSGDDEIHASDYTDDRIIGGSGDDTLSGQEGDDTIFGGDPNEGEGGGWAWYVPTDADVISGGDGADTLRGNGDSDTISGDAGADSIYGNKGDDDLSGLTGNDQLFGGDGADTILGNAGHDVIEGQGGADSLLGGDGMDFVFGNNGRDYIDGGDGDDFLYGGDGDDSIYGQDGDDHLYGELGIDLLNGGAGVNEVHQ